MKKHISLVYNGPYKKVAKAVEKANAILRDPQFYDHIRGCRNFENTVLSTFYVAQILENAGREIKVEATGLLSFQATKTISSDKIIVNPWSFNAPLSQRVNTLIRHTVDAIDMENKHIKKDKNRNNPNDTTAPNVIGSIAGVMVG